MIIGIRPVVIRRGTVTIGRCCPRCGGRRDCRKITWRNYFTLFFIPLFPVGTEKSGYECITCGLPVEGRDGERGWRAGEAAYDGVGEAGPPAGERSIVQCPRCDGRMRVPLRERGVTAICPHCAKEFGVKGERGEVPEAEVRE